MSVLHTKNRSDFKLKARWYFWQYGLYGGAENLN